LAVLGRPTLVLWLSGELCFYTAIRRASAEARQYTMSETQGEGRTPVPARGSLVGVSAALGMGGLLALSVVGNLALLACVLAATLVVARFAHRLGPWTAMKIEGRGLLPALGYGVLSGLACLLCTALCAAGLGLIWAGYDGFSDRYLVGNYLGKPVLAVLGYGLMPATVLGALCGGVLWGWGRVRKPASPES